MNAEGMKEGKDEGEKRIKETRDEGEKRMKEKKW